MDISTIDEEFVSAGSGVERSRFEDTGLFHLTDVIHDLQNSLGWGYDHSKPFGDSKYVVMEVGFLWEDLLTRVFADRMAHRPDEVTLDGIVGSPDGVGPDPDGIEPMVLEEYKATWRSNRRSPLEDWYWMTQTKSYCKMVGATVVIMRILYLMGDYKGSGPQYRVSRIVYTEKEVDDNWRVIVDHSHKMLKAMEVGNED